MLDDLAHELRSIAREQLERLHMERSIESRSPPAAATVVMQSAAPPRSSPPPAVAPRSSPHPPQPSAAAAPVTAATAAAPPPPSSSEAIRRGAAAPHTVDRQMQETLRLLHASQADALDELRHSHARAVTRSGSRCES